MVVRLAVYLPFRGKHIWTGSETVPAGSTPVSLLTHLGLDHHPELVVLVDGRYHAESEPVPEGCEVAILRRSEGG